MSIFIGLIAGFINGLFGSGAGMIVLPGLISVMKLDSKVARGTSLFILVIVSFVTCFFMLEILLIIQRFGLLRLVEY